MCAVGEAAGRHRVQLTYLRAFLWQQLRAFFFCCGCCRNYWRGRYFDQIAGRRSSTVAPIDWVLTDRGHSGPLARQHDRFLAIRILSSAVADQAQLPQPRLHHQCNVTTTTTLDDSRSTRARKLTLSLYCDVAIPFYESPWHSGNFSAAFHWPNACCITSVAFDTARRWSWRVHWCIEYSPLVRGHYKSIYDQTYTQ